jgi:3-phenylpropionate/trans-cinnamate dioxygenase ferredoxin reductase component
VPSTSNPAGRVSVASRVVIVGASAAGLGMADALRRRGHDGTIQVLDSGHHEPYERPPLSKQFLPQCW